MDTKHTLHMRHDKDGNVRPEAIGSHTPGPWKAVPCNEAGNINDIVNADGYRAAGTFGRTKDEQEANARLIAAAPELLEELSKLANKVFGYGHGEPSEEDRLRIIALIAKATTPNT